MAHPRRFLVGVATVVAFGVLTACTPSTTATIPTVATSSATPSPSPSVTYGPNQTAALAAVTGYYAWWNAARKDPRNMQLKELPNYVDLYASAYSTTPGDVNALATLGYRQVGDMHLTSVKPSPENASKVAVTVCLDRSETSLLNSTGATVDPRDPRSGATIPAAQVFTRRTYSLDTGPKPNGWVITAISGGGEPC